MTKRPDPKAAAAWVAGGAKHRPEHKEKLEKGQREGSLGGRPRAFDEETGRLNVQLPMSLIEEIVLRSKREKKTIGQIIAEALRSAQK